MVVELGRGLCGCWMVERGVELKTRGRNGVFCDGRSGDGGEDACVFLAILILILISILSVNENGVHVLIFAVELCRSWGMCFGCVVYDGVDDGGSARPLCRCCRLRNASFVCRAVRHHLCVCVIVVSSARNACRLHLADVSSRNDHLRPSAHPPDALAEYSVLPCH